MENDLEKYRYDYEIIRATANQVIKDFNVAGFEITFSGNELFAYDELKKQIEPVLIKLFKDTTQFQNLLYRIDLSEKKLQSVLNEPDSRNIFEKISDLILHREFQKVLTKKHFS